MDDALRLDERRAAARPIAPPSKPRRSAIRENGVILAGLGALALVSCVLFMTIDARGAWGFVLPFRGAKLAAMLLVGHAIAVSTILFQTISANRILTPSIMGFDAFYGLIQTVLVFFAGAAFAAALDPKLLFTVETITLIGFASLLYGTLLSTGARDIHRLLLSGVILGVLFRSVSGLMQRLIDPTEFVVVQDRLFASFNSVDTTLLGISAIVIAVVTLAVIRMLPVLDVLALGREPAISLGIEHRRMVLIVLGIVASFVAVSTALVGPVAFFGLLVASLARVLVGSREHAATILAASLLAAIALVAGQTILERVLGFDAVLGMVVEFIGGIVFLVLLLKRGTA
ncbi:enterobactin ABC transporter permease [Fulvimarina endophytica]|uniref:Enterobactin ABC transporter permease n=1 Tax=Fulvimarina endophytica TaxID=2293836 RepID=A0A371XAA5_9HYPH|nr:iron chelate uptake ABC transporter family permease subunit [Fulvimarina endophytica]RFC66131.1 enterobactin ABC transporter permease [Fulvimarina endophytica]